MSDPSKVIALSAIYTLAFQQSTLHTFFNCPPDKVLRNIRICLVAATTDSLQGQMQDIKLL